MRGKSCTIYDVCLHSKIAIGQGHVNILYINKVILSNITLSISLKAINWFVFNVEDYFKESKHVLVSIHRNK